MSKPNFWRTICLVCVFCAMEAIGSPAQTFTTLLSFNGTDGAQPAGSLLQGTDGKLYGTTTIGGTYTSCNNGLGCGTVFKIIAGGTLTKLHSFDGTDGAFPFVGLALATDGNFYGATALGGAYGYGTVFKITPGGTLTTLHNFDYTDGAFPYAGLVQANNGKLYGTASGGGNSVCQNGCGTIFEITSEGALTTLHEFCSQANCIDGQKPVAPLVQASDGNLDGTTSAGGANSDGTLFEITPGGKLTTVHSFDSPGGANGLIQATNGNLYGTTSRGGANGLGTVFKITPGGTLTTLHSFDGTDGSNPSGLVQATDGNFYATTSFGGSNDGGTVFEVTAGGALTTLYSFCQASCSDGERPEAGLLQATNGSFYGTTAFGGANTDGTVFDLSVGLGPFVKTLPTSGKAGTPVKIFGNHLTGATSVTFDGTPLIAVMLVSSTEITTFVPSSATTGYFTVTTPRGTLRSNVKFQVRP